MQGTKTRAVTTDRRSPRLSYLAPRRWIMDTKNGMGAPMPFFTRAGSRRSRTVSVVHPAVHALAQFLAGLEMGTNLSGTCTAEPVLGLRPVRGGR